jgi:hypothetical protein
MTAPFPRDDAFEKVLAYGGPFHICRKNLHATHASTQWKVQLQESAANAFGPGGNATPQSSVDVKSLHAKIGELMLENVF